MTHANMFVKDIGALMTAHLKVRPFKAAYDGAPEGAPLQGSL